MSGPVEPRRGRPTLPADEARSVELKIRVTPSERDRIAAAAERDGVSVSDLGRQAMLDRAARK